MYCGMHVGCQLMICFVQGADVINGIHTDIVCTEFEDRLFIVLSQCEKLGTLVCRCFRIVKHV